MDHESVRIAVLIDADNTSPKYAESLLEELAKYGTPTIKRCYGDFSSQRLSGWTRELNRRAIRAIHQNAFTTGKNSTDSALIIDAMDLLYADNVEAFAIVTSDSDFTSLALRLRESGKVVYGLGRKRTPLSLQNACDRFILLENLGEDDTEDTEDVEDSDGSAEDTPKLNLESVMVKAVNATADDDGWSSVSRIGNHLSRTQASFDPRSFGHSKLSSLVAAQKYLATEKDGRVTRVRLKQRQATAKKTPAENKTAPAKKAPAENKTAPAKKAPVEKQTPPADKTPETKATTTVRRTTRSSRTAKKAAAEA